MFFIEILNHVFLQLNGDCLGKFFFVSEPVRLRDIVVNNFPFYIVGTASCNGVFQMTDDWRKIKEQ